MTALSEILGINKLINASNIGIKTNNGKYTTLDKFLKKNKLVKLWENPNPTADFVAQNITLSSTDYDYLMFFFKEGQGFGMTLKGQRYSHGFAWDYNGGSGDNWYNASFRRSFEKQETANSLYVSDCYVRYGNSTSNSVVNSYCVPIAIYGGKF